MPQKYLNRILNTRVYDVAIESPLNEAPGLSARLNNNVLIKREDLQPVFSFKLRGAYNKLINMPEAARKKGVIAASAGNHAQGVALAASRMNVPATIVRPQTTPEIKVNAVRKWGGKVVLNGDDFATAYTKALEIIDKKGLTLLHPFDDPDVIAGQGTVGMEILRQRMGDIHAIFVPIGGGGLKAGRRIILDQVGIFADGVAVAQVGKETLRLARKLIDEVVLADVDQICASVKDLFDDTRAIAEPS
ncbi:MAG: pyridoxal-phosphate dependent enzyme, partial [Pseudomonadota bacterium]|nr:pyridoxal-phosphate dependent enzyme [Pseudomonadota bacterium]